MTGVEKSCVAKGINRKKAKEKYFIIGDKYALPPNIWYMDVCDVSRFYTFTTVETYFFVPERLWNSDKQKLSNFRIDFFYCSVISPFAIKFFYYRLVLIAQRKILVLATPVTSSNLRNQALLFTELRLLQGTLVSNLVQSTSLNFPPDIHNYDVLQNAI